MSGDSFESLIKKAFDAVDRALDQKLNPDQTSGNPASESRKAGKRTAHSINRSDESDYTNKMNSFYAVCARVYNPKNTTFEPGSYPYRKYQNKDKKPRLTAIKACIPEAHNCLPLLKPGEPDYNVKLEFFPTFYSDKPFVQRPGIDEYVKVTFGDMDNNLDGIFLTSDYRAIEGTTRFRELPPTAATSGPPIGAEYPELIDPGRNQCKSSRGEPWSAIKDKIQGKSSPHLTTKSDHANIISPDPLLIGQKISSRFFDDCRSYRIPTRTNLVKLKSNLGNSAGIHNDWATYRYDPAVAIYKWHSGQDIYPQRGGRYVSVPYPDKTIFKRIAFAPNRGNGFSMFLEHQDFPGSFEMKLVHLGSETLKWILVYCFDIPEESIEMFTPEENDISFLESSTGTGTETVDPIAILNELYSADISTGKKLRIPYWPVAPKGKKNAYRLYKSTEKGKGTTGIPFFENKSDGEKFQDYINKICTWATKTASGGLKIKDEGKVVKIGTIIRPRKFISGSGSHLHLAVRSKASDNIGNPSGPLKWGNAFALMDVNRFFAINEYSTNARD